MIQFDCKKTGFVLRLHTQKRCLNKNRICLHKKGFSKLKVNFFSVRVQRKQNKRKDFLLTLHTSLYLSIDSTAKNNLCLK